MSATIFNFKYIGNFRVYVRKHFLGFFFSIAVRFIEFLKLFFQGETNRAIAAHSLNKQSSRSHCIFTVYLEVSLLIKFNFEKERFNLLFSLYCFNDVTFCICRQDPEYSQMLGIPFLN